MGQSSVARNSSHAPSRNRRSPHHLAPSPSPPFLVTHCPCSTANVPRVCAEHVLPAASATSRLGRLEGGYRDIGALAAGILHADRYSIARAITLSESTLVEHQRLVRERRRRGRGEGVVSWEGMVRHGRGLRVPVD